MFVQMLDEVAIILGSATGKIESIDQCDPAIFTQAQETIAQYMAKLGENIQITEIFAIDLGDMQAATYLHNGGKIAAVVMYRNGTDAADQTAKQVAMQIAAMNPQYMTIDQIPVSQVDSKQAEFEAELKAAGKPEAMIIKIAEGKINKYFADLVLMNQLYIGDEGTTIAHLIDGVFEFVGARRFAV